jgi:hypothetical protein
MQRTSQKKQPEQLGHNQFGSHLPLDKTFICKIHPSRRYDDMKVMKPSPNLFMTFSCFHFAMLLDSRKISEFNNALKFDDAAKRQCVSKHVIK